MSNDLQVRVNDEFVLDAGTCEKVVGPHGPEWLVRPPKTTLFRQVLAYLEKKPDPPKRPSGSMVGREGVAAAALALRWGTYLAVLLDRDKPIWPEVDSPSASRISDDEMARINIEASAALAEWIDLYRADPTGGHPMNLEKWRSAAKDAIWALDFFLVRTAKGVWLSVLLVIDLHTREILELRACDAWGPTADWTIRTFASAMHREQRRPAALVHDHGTHFLGQFERQLRVLEIERRRTPIALPFVNGSCERVVKSVRLEMLNHVRVRDAEELQWYLDEYRRYYLDERSNQATGGQTPAAFGRGEQLAEVLDLETIRRRRLVRKSYAKGLLNSYELVEDGPPKADRHAA